MDHSASHVIVCSSSEELSVYNCKKALDPQYTCLICGRKYSSLSALKVHHMRHRKKDDLPYHCLLCSYKSATKRDLLRHHDQHDSHSRALYKCHLCTKVFKISSSLSEHIKCIHAKETTYKCGKCGFMTQRRSTFRMHLKNHGVSKVNIICPVCGSFFKTKSNLKIHLLSHADAKPFSCSHCDQRFTLQCRLNDHVQAVHGPKTFVCETCSKSFPSIHRLKRHLTVHTGERPFSCCFCPFTSSTQGNLMKHIREVHQMFNFTYKDVLIEIGKSEDFKKDISPEEIRKLTESGQEVSEIYLKQLKSKGLTSFSLEQLQKNLSVKKKAKEAVITKLRQKRGRRIKCVNESTSKLKQRNEVLNDVKKEETKEIIIPKSLSNNLSISDCDNFVLPKMENGNYVIHPNGSIEGSEVMATTPTIHVIWNVSVDDHIQNQVQLSTSKKKRRNKDSGTNNKCKTPTKAKSLIYNDIVSDPTDFPFAEHPKSPSQVLKGADDLTFHNDKPVVLNSLNEATDFHGNNTILISSLDNLHNVDSLSEFSGMDSPTTIVVAPEGVNDFDGMCTKLGLYNHFLPMSDDDLNFINAIDSPSTKPTYHSKLKDCTRRKPSLSTSEQPVTVSSSARQLQLNSKLNFESSSINKTIRDSSTLHVNKVTEVQNNSTKTNSLKDSCYLTVNVKECVSKKELNKEISLASRKRKCFTPCKSNQSGSDSVKPEGAMIMHGCSDLISNRISLQPEMNTTPPSNSVREITIKNSQPIYKFLNDQMDVLSIAEIEDCDKDVVLVIDTLD